jgi:hypothetical protein
MKYASSRPFADPEAGARKLLDIANATVTVDIHSVQATLRR